MAQRRRSTSRPTGSTARPRARRSRSSSRSGGGLPKPSLSLGLSPAVVRSLVGIGLLLLGAISGIAFMLQGGNLTDWWRDLTAPFFGSGRFLFPIVLLIAGWYVEWGPGKEPGAPWGRTLLGIALAYAGLLGLLQLVDLGWGFTGGRIGRFLVSILEPNLTGPGAFVILAGVMVTGLLIAFDLPLRALLSPAPGARRPPPRRSRTARRSRPSPPPPTRRVVPAR